MPPFHFDPFSLVPLVLSAGGLIGGAVYASRRGLPSIQRQVARANKDLIEALEGQLALANAEVKKLRAQSDADSTRITALEGEVERLERERVRLYIRIDRLEHPIAP